MRWAQPILMSFVLGFSIWSGKAPGAEPNRWALLIGVDEYIQAQDLKYCGASLKLLLIDACRNDPRLGGQRSFKATDETRAFARSLSAEPLPEGVVLLNSCAPGEISWEEEEFGHGVFMHYVLQGMKGDADGNSDGKVSLGELSRWAAGKTKVYVARKFNDSQRPFLTGEYELGLLDFEFRLGAPREVANSIGMKLVLIPAGAFQMGSPFQQYESLKRAMQGEFPGRSLGSPRRF
jgi:hypothetical protein